MIRLLSVGLLGIYFATTVLVLPDAIRWLVIGLAKTIAPVNTTFDGDIMFALSLGRIEADVNNVGVLAEGVTVAAVKRAVTEADGFNILPAYRDLKRANRSK